MRPKSIAGKLYDRINAQNIEMRRAQKKAQKWQNIAKGFAREMKRYKRLYEAAESDKRAQTDALMSLHDVSDMNVVEIQKEQEAA